MTRSQHSSGWVGSTRVNVQISSAIAEVPAIAGEQVTCGDGGLPPQGSLKKTLQSGPWTSMGHSGVFVVSRCGFGHICPGGEPVI